MSDSRKSEGLAERAASSKRLFRLLLVALGPWVLERILKVAGAEDAFDAAVKKLPSALEPLMTVVSFIWDVITSGPALLLAVGGLCWISGYRHGLVRRVASEAVPPAADTSLGKFATARDARNAANEMVRFAESIENMYQYGGYSQSELFPQLRAFQLYVEGFGIMLPPLDRFTNKSQALVIAAVLREVGALLERCLVAEAAKVAAEYRRLAIGGA